MTEPTPFRGSIEVLIGAEPNTQSLGMAVQAATVDLVPVIVAAVHGLTGIAAVNPPRAGVVAEWTATNDRQQPVTVLLHQEPDIDQTLNGQVIQMVTEAQP